MSISLVSIAKYYEGEPHQDMAIAILQAELERTHPELLAENSEFMQCWKTPESAGDTANTADSDTEVPKTKILSVPYFSQLNNEMNPHGSCNVTSVAMCLTYLGYQHQHPGQLEDELYQYCLSQGLSRHSPWDLQELIGRYGYQDDFQDKAKWAEVKTWLAGGNPCIAHGWFTRSGHIVTLTGYNEKGWVVHDPYGEWFSWGYDTSVSGKNLTYSYGMMRQICGTDGDLWIHYVSKP